MPFTSLRRVALPKIMTDNSVRMGCPSLAQHIQKSQFWLQDEAIIASPRAATSPHVVLSAESPLARDSSRFSS